MSRDARARFERLAALWRRRAGLSAVLHTLALALPSLTLASVALEGRPGRVEAAIAGVAALALAAWVIAGRRHAAIGAAEIARHLDRAVPALQESSTLLLREPARLPLLGRLQYERVLAVLEGVDGRATLPTRALASAARWALAGLGMAGVIAFGVTRLPAASVGPQPGGAGVTDGGTAARGPVQLEIEVEIVPPTYTGLRARSVRGLDLAAEEGAALHFTVTGDPGGEAPFDAVELIFDESERLALATDGAGRFVGTVPADAPHVYYLVARVAGEERYRSAFARLQVIPDRAPDLRVIAPAGRVTLDPAGALRLKVQVEAEDDYGLSDAELVVTLASGAGEMVKFREQRTRVAHRGDHPGPQALTTTLDLAALGMQPGSDLYFHLEVTDNRRPEPNRARTPSWIASMPGPGPPSIALDGGLPVVRLPEYFRSQRQIIIDTERLIAEQSVITRAEFERRAQAIGFDQRALRMRYGTILGEQFESGIPLDESAEGSGHDDAHADEALALGEEEDPTEALLEGFVHEHDSEENATFFTTAIKLELRAALSAMWDAEGSLRTYAPEEALPAEYVALKHIKAVQHGGRVYVLKVGFEAPPLDVAAKRLTGDLSKIKSRRRSASPKEESGAVALHRALDLLEALRDGVDGPPADADAVLAQAARRVAERARREGDRGTAGDPDATEPGLETLDALHRLRGALARAETPDPDDVDRVLRDLWSALPRPDPRPHPRRDEGSSLYGSYLRRLEER